MTQDELHVLATVRDENHGLLVGYCDVVDRLVRSRVLLVGPSGLWLSERGTLMLADHEAQAGRYHPR